jgi:pimeloyl-ACP methyl ester carboxylesterase
MFTPATSTGRRYAGSCGTGYSPKTKTDRGVFRTRSAAVPAGLAITVAGGTAYVVYARELNAIRQRIVSSSNLIQTRHGLIEYASWGEGTPALVLHGAGGGYDQGITIARTFGGPDFHWISPSRFGYLRSPLAADAGTAAQADAVADVLDAIGIERVPILAMSGGVPPALQFAARYPERAVALVLLSSAPHTPLTATDAKTPVPMWVYYALFSSDFPYWIMTKVARRQLEAIYDVTPALRANMTPQERVFVDEMIDNFEPASWRVAGLRNEGAAVDPSAVYELDRITAPSLVIHARDDGMNAFAFGVQTADRICNAEFLPLDRGGHLLLGHHAEVRHLANALFNRP